MIRTTRQRDASNGWNDAIDGDWRGGPSAHCSACGAIRANVHMAMIDETTGDIAVLSYACKDGRYPSVGAHHPPAHAARARDPQFVRLGCGGRTRYAALARSRVLGRTASARQKQPAQKPAPYAFLPVEGESLHQIPVGPVHAGIIEPGHFRFTANGEHVVRLEQRLGYVHKGIESLMAGATLENAAKLAGRTSGDSTVAYAYAFAQAAEAALQIEPPPRAVYLRALMAELERLANHFGDIGAICNDASFAIMHAQTGILRERVLARGGCLFRPPPDDGRNRARRRRARSRGRRSG